MKPYEPMTTYETAMMEEAYQAGFSNGLLRGFCAGIIVMSIAILIILAS
jgi:hypothetical protein